MPGPVNSAVIVSRTNEGIMKDKLDKDKLETGAAESASLATGEGVIVSSIMSRLTGHIVVVVLQSKRMAAYRAKKTNY